MTDADETLRAAKLIADRLDEGIERAKAAGLETLVELLKMAQEEARRAAGKKNSD